MCIYIYLYVFTYPIICQCMLPNSTMFPVHSIPHLSWNRVHKIQMCFIVCTIFGWIYILILHRTSTVKTCKNLTVPWFIMFSKIAFFSGIHPLFSQDALWCDRIGIHGIPADLLLGSVRNFRRNLGNPWSSQNHSEKKRPQKALGSSWIHMLVWFF